MVRTVKCALLFQEHFPYGVEHRLVRLEYADRGKVHPARRLDFCIREFLAECWRYVSGECREDRRHSEGPLSVEYALLEFLVLVHQIVCERAAPPVEVAHPEPVEICRAAEKAFQFLISESQ